MAVPIRYRAPYQIDVLAKDLTTGKRVGNTWYCKNLVATGPSPGYGNAVAGSSTATLLASFKALYESTFMTLLSLKYIMVSYTMRAIIGYGYQTPYRIISGATFGGTTAQFLTAVPHGLVTGDMVSLSGITTPTGVNGIHSVTAVSANVFQINTTALGLYTGSGTAQKVQGGIGWVYRDKEELTTTAVGLVTGEALPIFNDVDVRRINAGVGKSFRSRVGMAIIAESDAINGSLNAAAITAWGTQLAAYNTTFSNGGSDATAGLSFHIVCPKKIAALQSSPFTTAEDFALPVDQFTFHTRLGSQVNRKPTLAGS